MLSGHPVYYLGNMSTFLVTCFSSLSGKILNSELEVQLNDYNKIPETLIYLQKTKGDMIQRLIRYLSILSEKGVSQNDTFSPHTDH